jgi:hypothetical protein
MAKPTHSQQVYKRLTSLERANQVTSLSKVLAAVLFVTLPFVGFAIGYTQAGGLLTQWW